MPGMASHTPHKASGWPKVLPVKATPRSTAQAILRASRHLDSPRSALAPISTGSPRFNRSLAHAVVGPDFGREASNLDKSAVDFDELFKGVASEIEQLSQPKKDVLRTGPNLGTDGVGTSFPVISLEIFVCV